MNYCCNNRWPSEDVVMVVVSVLLALCIVLHITLSVLNYIVQTRALVMAT